MVNKISISSFILAIYIFYGIGASTNGLAPYYLMALFLLWIFFSAFTSSTQTIGIKIPYEIWIMLFFAIYFFVFGQFFSGWFIALKSAGLFLILYSPLIFNYVYPCWSQKAQVKIKNFLFFEIVCLILFSLLLNLFLLRFPNGARTNDMSRFMGNVMVGGGYTVGYYSTVLTAFFIVLLKQKVKLFPKWLIIIALVLFFFSVIQIRSTYTIICWFASTIIAIIFPQKQVGLKKIIILLLFSIFSLIFVTTLLNFIGLLLIEKFSESSMSIASRLVSFGYLLLGDIKNGEYGVNRMAIIIRSLNTFLSNPILGVSYKVGFAFTDEYQLGNHCEWTDVFAKYGLPFGLLFYVMYLSPYYKLKAKRVRIINLFPVFFSVFILGLFNPFIQFSTNLVVLHFIPQVWYFLRQREER